MIRLETRTIRHCVIILDRSRTICNLRPTFFFFKDQDLFNLRCALSSRARLFVLATTFKLASIHLHNPPVNARPLRAKTFFCLATTLGLTCDCMHNPWANACPLRARTFFCLATTLKLTSVRCVHSPLVSIRSLCAKVFFVGCILGKLAGKFLEDLNSSLVLHSDLCAS